MHRMLQVILTVVFTLSLTVARAQCSMCKAVAESNMDGGGGVAAGLNSGIMYLMAIPYLLIGIIAFLWYRHTKAHSAQ